jgi:hypothetical protein
MCAPLLSQPYRAKKKQSLHLDNFSDDISGRQGSGVKMGGGGGGESDRHPAASCEHKTHVPLGLIGRGVTEQEIIADMADLIFCDSITTAHRKFGEVRENYAPQL